ncbi:MAG: CHAT domain-containing protein [Anaerolineales bacterium]|nr:CHAT domain-containing protein [Anaerolineales bacterium]
MAKQEFRPEALLEIIPNPAGDAFPYHIELTDLQMDRTLEADFTLDLGTLKGLFAQSDPAGYGEYLFTQVFHESVSESGSKGEIGNRLDELLREVENKQGELTLKLEIARKLHPVRAIAWEALLDPQKARALASHPQLAFHRDVNIDAPQREAIQGKPRVLVVVASPDKTQLELLAQRYRGEIQENLTPINIDEEVKELTHLFEPLRTHLTYHILQPQPGQTTIESISAALRGGGFHILHLSSHGATIKGKAYLILTGAQGEAKLVSEEEFAKTFSGYADMRLVVLDACRSAEYSDTAAISGMVPRLMQHVPAAIGMQRPWYTGSADRRFTTTFYAELGKHGYVDRALQRSRHSLREWQPQRWEWGTPVLYLHLKQGRLFEPEARSSSERRTSRTRPQAGGTGIHIGKDAKVEGLKIKGRVAGRDIGAKPPGDEKEPKEAANGGTGIKIDEGATVKDVEIKGEVAGGNIYRELVMLQENERFGKKKQRQALMAQVAYYEEKSEDLALLLEEPGEDRERLEEELNDLQDEIEEARRKLNPD